MPSADKTYDLLLDILADLLIEDLAAEERKKAERTPKYKSAEISNAKFSDLTEAV